ncbi:RagB/SusD family nutrient uptake outer membrane protein [Prevotella sp. 10(H)]|uniref:RagB/SusD family nutrient uptake outer membrane protein n=1 Tax=Prevotella sp. 10(H) TaxID=1158294 RepID=UPI0004A703F4|nr:RagB/SusD family nutrient uptake outer membrane protein [Prevotella sp. 10(H)]
MKKYIINKLCISFVLILTVLTYTACNDMLDQKPQGTATDTSGTFESKIFGLYGKARGWSISSGTPVLAIQGFRSEDAEKGSSADDGDNEANYFDNFQYNKVGMIEGYWSAHFELIQNANSVIDDMKAVPVEEQNDRFVINYAEAHFFRAFAFFNLVRAFGEVPLLNFKINEGEEAKANIPKSSIADIYKQIDDDLKIAEEGLPTSWEKKFIGRLTWGAARALHAKTYLTRNDWPNTYAAAMDVVSSGIYNLDTPFNQIFRESGENSSESVLEFQCTAVASESDINKYGSQFSQAQGVRGGGEWDLGWGWHTPTEILANAFEPNDPRKDETLLYFYKSQAEADAPGAIANKPWGEKPIAYGTVIAKYFNKKAYTDPALRDKYASASRQGGWVNIRIIRFADVVLMAAEAANEMGGKTDEALELLERIRARARGGDNTILPEVTTTDQAELRNAIRHERRIELAMEFDRFYDLVRWGIAKDVLHAAGKTNYEDKHALLPIPQLEIDKSNGVLVQNPNY